MTIRTKPASKEYRDGWDRVFGKERPETKARQPRWTSDDGGRTWQGAAVEVAVGEERKP